MEQFGIALLLLCRRISPESPKAETCHAIDVHGIVDDLGQPPTLLPVILWSVHDAHELVADDLDERTGAARHPLGEYWADQPIGGCKQRGCGQNQECAA